MQHCKIVSVALVGVVALLTALPQAEGKPQQGHVQHTVSPSSQPLQVTALAVPTSATNSLLEIQLWQFDIKLPNPAHQQFYTFSLNARGKGQDSHLLDINFSLRDLPQPANGHIKITIGAYPINNELRKAEKIKCMMRIEPYHRIPSPKTDGMAAGGGSTTVVAANPFQSLTAETLFAPNQRKDGSFLLRAGVLKEYSAWGNDDAPHDAELIFRVLPPDNSR